MDMYQKREMRKNKKMDENTKSLPSTSINWYPGHMAKTKRLIKENINLIDIIYEVIDSRVPYSSKINDLEDLISNKPKILIFTKYDLCDKDETDKFIEAYQRKGYNAIKYDLSKEIDASKILDLSNEILKEKLDNIRQKGINKTTIRALVVGVPNAGKSTLINKIVGRKTAITGNKPGVTKNLNWIRVGKNIELLDSPGILWPKLEQEKEAYNLASTTAIKEDVLPKEEIAIYIIKFLHKYYPDVLESYYGVTDISDFYEVYEVIGKRRGFIMRGGIIDDDRVTDLVINDIKQGKIKGITFDRIEDYEL
ncbi:MAG: ribosome biogenesis GTPase YlqF [Bacilli bacterium]